jgi:hypothetical protein
MYELPLGASCEGVSEGGPGAESELPASEHAGSGGPLPMPFDITEGFF